MLTTSHSPIVTASAPSPTSFHYGPSCSTLAAHCSPRHHAASPATSAQLVEVEQQPPSPHVPTSSVQAPTSASGSTIPLPVAGAGGRPATLGEFPTASTISSPSQLSRRQSLQIFFSPSHSPPSPSRNSHSPASSAPSTYPSRRLQYAPTEPTLSSSSRPDNTEMDRPDSTPPHPPASHPPAPNPITAPISPSQVKLQLQQHQQQSQPPHQSPATREPPNPRSPVKRRNPSTAPPGPRTTAHSTTSNNSDHISASPHHASTRDPDSPSKRARAETRPKILPIRYETMEVEDLVVLISHMLGELIATNDPMALTSGRLTRFHSRTAPGISVRDYLHRIAKHATLTPAVLLSMVYYIDRLCSLYPEFTINTLTVHRFLITAATVGAKGLSDSFWNNTTYARVGGVRVQELKTLELEFLNRVDWKIVPQPEVLVAYYKGLIKRCPDYILEEEPDTSSGPTTTTTNDGSSGGESSPQDDDSTEISADDSDVVDENLEFNQAISDNAMQENT